MICWRYAEQCSSTSVSPIHSLFPMKLHRSPEHKDKLRERAMEPKGRGETEELRISLLSSSSSSPPPPPPSSKDGSHIAYAIYFILGAGILLPWNAFITAIDYFSYLYPSTPVVRVFNVAYTPTTLIFLFIIISSALHKSGAALRINAGLALSAATLLVIPVMEVVYIRGQRELQNAYYVTVGVVVLSGVANALVQGGVTGDAGELPERYIQAVSAGTAASGVLVSAMRLITKAMFPQDAHGLRNSANLYFAVSFVSVAICLVCYNVAQRLPVIKYYRDLKMQAIEQEATENGSVWRSRLWSIVQRIRGFGLGIFLIYGLTLSIFPGRVTEDAHSEVLKDWYPILLIAGFNVSDLVGKSLPAIYLPQNTNVAVGAGVARLLFYPLFLGCLRGPEFVRTEIPVAILTCLLGLTNGYFGSVVMIHAPKSVPIQHAGTAGIVMVVFLTLGLAAGSIVSWF